MKVAIEIARLWHIGVTLETVSIANRSRERGRLFGSVRDVRNEIDCADLHGRCPPGYARARVTVYAPGRLILMMEGSQIHRDGLTSTIKGPLRFGMTRRTKGIVLFQVSGS